MESDEHSYWQQKLAGAPPAPSLPWDFPRPPVPSFLRLTTSIVLDRDLTARWMAASGRWGIDPSTMLFAAMRVVLFRYSGQDDILAWFLGSGADGSPNRLLPFRSTLGDESTPQELIRQTEALLAEMSQHASISDASLLQLVPTSASSGAPAASVGFVASGTSSDSVEQARGILNQCDLVVEVDEGAKASQLSCNYDEELFDQPTIHRLLGHLSMALSGLLGSPVEPISRLPLTTEAERDALIFGLNQTQRNYPTDVCLHELFQQQVVRSPDAVALVYEDQELTYRQLNGRANQLAHFLRERGVEPDTRVGVFMHRSPEMVVSLYAILKAGGAYVPLDPDYPRERLSFMLEDAGCDLILTQNRLAASLPEKTRAGIIAIDEQWSMISGSPQDDLPRVAKPTDLAYVIYTSGSTGRPKGVMNEHAGICNRLFWMQEAFELQDDDCVLQKTPFSFDVSVWEFFWPLLFGAKLVMARPDGHRDPDYLVGLIEQHGVTTIHFVPSMLQVFLRAKNVESCCSLRRVICSGEALGYELQELFFQRLGAQLHNLYGPTEAAVDVTHWACRRSDDRQVVPIGKPIANTKIYVLDPALHPVPVGTVGELHIGGVQVARGYLNRPELTSQKFIRDPFVDQPAARMYKTGDLARFLSDGNIEYLGRIDHQVKIRGFRIELGEIESALREHEGVDEAIVLARQDNPGENRLVAYLICHRSRPDVTRLRSHLQQKLPEYMVPSAFVFLDRFPLTHSGKVDRKALPAPDAQRPELADRFVAPRTPAEEKLAAIWRDVLRIEKVGVHDNYFELGGDSIQSTLVISAAQKVGLKLTPKQLFESPTIAELAAAAEQTGDAVRHQQGPVVGESPLTPIQRWFFEQRLADAHHFNQSFLFVSRQSLDVGALRTAMTAVQDHHDALRLRFRGQGEHWRQEFAAPEACEISLQQIDLATVPESEVDAEIARTAARFQSSLDIEKGTVWRVIVIRTPDGTERVLMIVHHLVVDGVSWRILLEDLERAYHQASRDQTIELAPKTTSFKAWAEHLREYATDATLASEATHWNQLDESDSLPIPPDHQGAEITEASAQKVTVSLTRQETEDLLQRVPQAYNTMINDVLLTALAMAVQSQTGNRKIVINLEGHGREDLFDGVDLSRTVGWFTTIYPVALEIPESNGVQRALKAVKEQLRSVPRRGIGYGVQRYLGGDTRSASVRRPDPSDRQILFNYFGRFDDVVRDSQLFEFADQVTGRWRSPRQRRPHALEINCMILGGRLQIEWTYCSSLHRRETIDAVAGDLLQSLKDIIAHCLSSDAGGYTPSDFPLCGLDQPQLDRLVAGSRDIEDIYPPSPIQLLFLARAASQSDAILDHWQCTLRGALDLDAFQRAWQDVFDCHGVLRTAGRREGLREPLQVVHRNVRLPWTIDDWTGQPADRQLELWQRMLSEDRASGMALDKPPLSRFTLVRLSDDTHRFLWTVPALLLDGWSWPLVFAGVSKAYQALVNQRTVVLDRPRSYRAYLTWLRDHVGNFDEPVSDSRGESGLSQREFWQSNLAGLSGPTPLRSESPPEFGEDDPFQRVSCLLDDPTVERLGQTIRTRATTIGALVQAAWSLVLSRLSGQLDVTFGAAFSGRPTDLAGAESMVGPFTNNLPVRVKLAADQSLGELLTQSHRRLLRLNPYQFVPAAQIQSWSDVPWHQRLFDSLVVVQNYVVQESARNLGPGVSIEEFDGPVHTNYPLLVLVEPDSHWRISMIFDRRVIAPAAAERWKADLVRVLRRLGDDLSAGLATVMDELSEPVAAGAAHRKLFVQSQNFVPPRTPTQKTIAQVWQETIGLDRISIEDNLFDLGVHSMLVVQLHRRLQDQLGKQIGLVTLFQYPTILALAGHLDADDQGVDRLEQTRDRGQRQRQMLASMKNARARIKR